MGTSGSCQDYPDAHQLFSRLCDELPPTTVSFVHWPTKFSLTGGIHSFG